MSWSQCYNPLLVNVRDLISGAMLEIAVRGKRTGTPSGTPVP
jgi:hypothetical protein